MTPINANFTGLIGAFSLIFIWKKSGIWGVLPLSLIYLNISIFFKYNFTNKRFFYIIQIYSKDNFIIIYIGNTYTILFYFNINRLIYNITIKFTVLIFYKSLRGLRILAIDNE